MMDKKVEGAWLIHHTNKLQTVSIQSEFEDTRLAGKAGILLSAISSDDTFFVSQSRLIALAKASNISVKLELPILLTKLKDKRLIDEGSGGIEVLGVTSSSTLQHTSDIFQDLEPSSSEKAAIELAERASIRPLDSKLIKEELSDLYKLKARNVDHILDSSEKIGFIDVESVDETTKIYFNGNLFRRDTTQKIKIVLESLSQAEQTQLVCLTELLKSRTCIPVEEAKIILGEILFSKLGSIGIFDLNVVSNVDGDAGFITLPSAFSKYSSSMVDDAFDLAKAFVSSLTYGMTKSQHQRGKIQMISALLNALIDGRWVGPVAAIGQDYNILEMKNVVKVEIRTKGQRKGPMMKLLKKEVGVLALQAIQEGDVSEQSLSSFPSAAVTHFRGPETNREGIRRKQVERSPKATRDMLTALRTGGLQ